ncbi:MAG TPA: phospholipase D-like domain-containing protein [Thermoanaerobaculia bacterium]|nr:phospholipase D-like domain-containing protein [Thermoanaerobaculia bacterium]
MSPHRFRRFRPILRPKQGRQLPRELRGRNVVRLAQDLPQGVRDPGFQILLRRIDGAPLLGGNEVRIYVRGKDAFAAMREAVGAARREILLESYIYKDDATGRAFLEELSAAASRGVRVKVLADALGSFATRKAFWREMELRGIESRLFNPLFKTLWYQPFRDHRKILVVDGRIAFTGGMNIGDEYGSAPEFLTRPGSMESTWRDTHLRVIGPTAWEMAIVFAESWGQAGGTPLDLPTLDAAEAEAPGSRILVLDSRPKRGQAESAAALAAIVGAARRSVWITNSYFAPGWAGVRILGQAAQRGVDVRLLLPGLTDVPIVRHAGHGYFSRLLRHGVRVFEYQGSILHAKSLVADGYVSVVGSTNLDFRSFIFNAECDLLILCDKTARQMEENFETDLENAVEIRRSDWKRRRLLHRAGDRMARWLAPVL